MSNEERPTFHSIPLRRSETYQMRHSHERTTEAPRRNYVSSRDMPAIPDDDELYEPPRVPNSARRYQDRQGNTIIEQGDTRYVLHTERGPKPRPRPRTGKGLLIFGLGMIVMVAMVSAAVDISNHQQAAAQDAAFNAPIVTEQFHVVGHNNDSAEHPSYFEFINLRGRVMIVELPAGDPMKALIYTGPQILGQGAYTQQVSAHFEDVNGDGKVDMVVTVGGQSITFLNNGNKFVPEQP